jgi:DNA (cytosine-5)-methyltransferase 1
MLKNKYIPTAKSYFSGAGLMDLGFIQAGVDVIQSVDLDKRAVNTMLLNNDYFKHRILWDDVKEMQVLEQPKSDIQIFTYPCKKYSMIGEIHGVRTGDELFTHALRHIAIEQPEMYWVENVPGMKHFKVVMEAMTKLPGYYVNVFCPVNADNWLPQSRHRLLIVGTKRPFNITPPVKSNLRPSISDIIEKDVIINVNASVVARIKGKYRDKPIIVDPADKSSISPTCVAHYAKDMGTRLVKDDSYKHGVRPFTPREYARLQGLPDDYILPNKNYSYELIGNGVAVPMARWMGEQAMKYFN